MSFTYISPAKTNSLAPKTQPAAAPFKELIHVILRATRKAERGLGFAQEIDEASVLLESLPLTTEEFGLASNRLRNAHRYAMSGELGAARWELNTLRKALSWQDDSGSLAQVHRRHYKRLHNSRGR